MLFLLLCLLTLIHIPVFSTFAMGGYFSNGDWLMSLTIANLGFSKSECLSSSMIAGNVLQLKCATGDITELVDWGIVTHFEDAMQCSRL